MPRFKVTNTSSTSGKGARNVFLIEVGKLLKPGEHCVCNRLDNGTVGMAKAGLLKIEEGNFDRPPIFPPKEPAKKADTSAEDAAKAQAEAEAQAKAEAEAAAQAQAEAEATAAAKAEAEAAAQAEAEAAAQAEAAAEAGAQAEAEDSESSEDSEKSSKRSGKRKRGEG